MKTARCPICRKESKPREENRAFPFCSGRCRMVDLGNWFGEAYVVSRPIDPEADAEAVTKALEDQKKIEGDA